MSCIVLTLPILPGKEESGGGFARKYRVHNYRCIYHPGDQWVSRMNGWFW